MAKLQNREWNIIGDWYEPMHKLMKYKSVVKVEYFNTSSSSGDWSGLMVVEQGKKWLIIPFHQENNYPNDGFSLVTGLSLMTLVNRPTLEELEEMYIEFSEGY